MDKFKELEQLLKVQKPEGATTIYVVSWGLTYDSEYAMISNRLSQKVMENSRKFLDPEKAGDFFTKIQQAFKTLCYNKGYVYLTEDYIE